MSGRPECCGRREVRAVALPDDRYQFADRAASVALRQHQQHPCVDCSAALDPARRREDQRLVDPSAFTRNQFLFEQMVGMQRHSIIEQGVVAGQACQKILRGKDSLNLLAGVGRHRGSSEVLTMNPVERRPAFPQNCTAQRQTDDSLASVIIEPLVKLLSIGRTMNRFRLAQRVCRVAERALAGRPQKPEITAGVRRPAARALWPVVLVFVVPADQTDGAASFIEVRRRSPHHQLRHRVATHPRILEHQAGFGRNDERGIGHNEIKFFAGHRLEKAPLPE